MKLKDRIKELGPVKTPFYYYDTDILNRTLDMILKESDKYGFHVHYAIKANANSQILKIIAEAGFGADCVSGNEIKAAIQNGFTPDKIAFAGVGKSDEEILTGLNKGIFSFNIESLEELKVINKLAEEQKKKASIAVRINPNVDPQTHKYITTGIEETKFGVHMWDLEEVIDFINRSEFLLLKGLHFHIGSQISRLAPFKALCAKINEIQDWFNLRNIYPEHINVGGGLGIDYNDPDKLPDFEAYCSLFNDLLILRKEQKVHFELGRAVVGQAGSLISRVLYVKKGVNTDFLILDAGMTDFMRPALYQAYHLIENLSSSATRKVKYNIVGPVCESTDSFGRYRELAESSRGDLIAIRSAGAYGMVMASQYNLRDLPGEITGSS